MTKSEISVDIVLIGAGICGLWLLSDLRRRGYRCLLIAKGPTGAGQTMASQGIIHSGAKYGAAQAHRSPLQHMPNIWRRCFSGTGPVDLRNTRVLSQRMGLLSPGAVTQPTQWLDEPVIDVASLVHDLGSAQARWIRPAGADPINILKHSSGYTLETGIDRIATESILLCAGSSNPTLAAHLGAQSTVMQQRALRQIWVEDAALQPVYGHWLNSDGQPRVTVTSHSGDLGRVWYLGGELAEHAAHLSAEESVQRARDELALLFPGAVPPKARWGSLMINRSEAAQMDGMRPTDSVLQTLPSHPNIHLCWPTKLSLMPRLARQVAVTLDSPARTRSEETPQPHLDQAAIALYPWQQHA